LRHSGRESAFLTRKAPDASREGENLLIPAATEVAPEIQGFRIGIGFRLPSASF
jgi:hypothetical protein